MKDEPLRVLSCEFCQIFMKNELKTKLYWPEDINDINKSKFIIIDGSICGTPMVIIDDHIDTISKELWGKILYRCKRIFGDDTILKIKPNRMLDHFHAQIIIHKCKY